MSCDDSLRAPNGLVNFASKKVLPSIVLAKKMGISLATEMVTPQKG